MKSTYSNEILKLAKQIKKEHFLKIFLWGSGIILTVIWLTFMVWTSITLGRIPVYKGDVFTKQVNNSYDLEQIFIYLAQPNKYELIKIYQRENSTVVLAEFKEIAKFRDINPLCLVGDPTLTGWYVALLLSPLGYIGILFLIAHIKNMITPQKVKKTNRQALQFGYLRQPEVDLIINEIDYNIGIKKRPEEVDNEPKSKEIHT